MYGKEVRLKQLFDNSSNKSVIVPMDHGATLGPICGIENIKSMIGSFNKEYVNGVVLCKGQLNNLELVNSCNVPFIVHLSNSSIISPNINFKTLVGSVESAISCGATAVSVHINLGNENEHTMLEDFGKVADECFKWGIPLLAMMYVRAGGKEFVDVNKIKLAARIAQEVGADIVKVNYTGSIDSFREVVNGCSIPVIIAGGDVTDVNKILNNSYEAIQAGAAGVAYGRNVFQSDNPMELTKALSNIVHKGMRVDEVLSLLKKDKVVKGYKTKSDIKYALN